MTGSANFFMGHLDAGDFGLFSLCETHVRPNLLHPSQRRYHDIVAALGDRRLILRGLEVIPNQESSALHQSRPVIIGNTDTGPKRDLGNRSSFVAKGLPNRRRRIGRHCGVREDESSLTLQRGLSFRIAKN